VDVALNLVGSDTPALRSRISKRSSIGTHIHSYVRQINPVLLWGLLKGEDINPFDMIYEPSEGEDRSPGEKHKACKAVSGNVLALGSSLPPYEDPPHEESSGTEVSTGDIISVDDE